MSGKARRIRPPCFIELAGFNDLGRLTCALERAPLPIFSIEFQGGLALATQLDLFMGTPLFYYFRSKEAKHFLGYKNTAGMEEAIMTNSAANPAYIYAPIISVKRLPKVFRTGLEGGGWKKGKFISVQVNDLASLAKVCSYKMLFEEPPLPLFLFPQGDGWVLGAFTRIDEYEEASLFFYASLIERPLQNFLKYTTSRAEDAAFTNRLDEHGNIFIKIVRLASSHPLIEIESP